MKTIFRKCVDGFNKFVGLGHKGGILALCAALILSVAVIPMQGCSVATVFNDIANWVPVGEASLNSVLAVLAANNIPLTPGAQAGVKDIEDAFASVTAAVKEYQSATPPPVGALAKVQLALKAVTDQFGAFLANLQLPGGNILALVSGLAGVVFSTIAAFANQLPPAVAALFVARANEFRLSGQTFQVVPHQRTRRAFKKDFNSALDFYGKQGVIVPSSARLKLTLLERF